MRTIPERVTALETDNTSSKDDVKEIFRVLRATAETHAATARRQEVTQVQLDSITLTIGQHSNDIQRLNQALWMGKGVIWWVGGGGMAIGASILAAIKYLGGQ